MNDTLPMSKLLQRIEQDAYIPSRIEIIELLSAQGQDLENLYRSADCMRKKHVGDDVYLRGILEFSNYCRRNCEYCGIRHSTHNLQRYRMQPEEIITEAINIEKQSCTTIVLQSGEDPWYTVEKLCGILRGIKAKTKLAVTLSVGELSADDFTSLRKAGCDRYLLRFETSNRMLFRQIHPDDDFEERLKCLGFIRDAGIQLGSGFMIGLPPGSLETIADDILFATGLNLEMIGCGPFVPTPNTPLAESHLLQDKEVYFKTIAILRLLNPRAHIPATTAFDVLFPDGRDRLLRQGANVFMPNMTPICYSALYQLYPNKPFVDEDNLLCFQNVLSRIASMNRSIGKGPGHSLVELRRDLVKKP